MCCFTIDNPEVILLGRETIHRNGEIVGYLSSGGWGYTVNTNIGYGYVRCKEGVNMDYLKSGEYELEVASKLLRMVKKLGYKIIDQEISHFAPLTDDIWVAGRIDAVAELDGETVLIDFKTGANGWKRRKLETGEIVYFQALSNQGTIYLTPPAGVKDWPIEMHYLHAPNNGVTKVHPYYQNEDDRQNLIRLATLMKDAADRGWFPKNKGWQCNNCDWMHCCWETPGWNRYYTERE